MNNSHMVEEPTEPKPKRKLKVGKTKEMQLLDWHWKIQCGKCQKKLQLRPDGNLEGRLSYFQERKFFLLFN